MADLVNACAAGDFAAARVMHRRLMPWMAAAFVESNPIPVKAAMALMGLLEPVWRLPMCPPAPASLAKIEKVLETAGLRRAPVAV
jgi:4-hydroxy-tetrahydrodipicolinate synthase